MAGELQFSNSAFTGDTLYAHLFNASGQVYDTVGANFEAFVDAQVANYDIAMTEQGTASGLFTGTMPGVAAGVYSFTVRQQAGGGPAVTDPDLASGEIHWDGSAEVDRFNPTADTVDVGLVEGVDATDQIRDAILDDATRFSGADIDQSLSTTESNIRGADSDDLKDISDEIAALNDLSVADVLAQLAAYDGPTYDELLAFFQLLIRNDAAIAADRAAELAAINADEGSGAGDYDSETDSLEAISDAVPPHAGAIEWPYTVYEPDGVTPIAGVDVWTSTDAAGTNIVWRGVTDAFGAARDVVNEQPWLDAGTYYFWRQAAGYTFTNPDTEVVS